MDSSLATFWDHFEELRSSLVKIFFIIALGFIVALGCYEPLMSWLIQPLSSESSHHETIQIEKVYNKQSQALSFTVPHGAFVYGDQAGVSATDLSTYRIEPGHSLKYEIAIKKADLVILSPLEGMTLVFKLSFWMGLAITAPIWSFILLQFALPGLNQQERRIIIPFVLGSFIFMGAGVCVAYFMTIPVANSYLKIFNAGIGTNLWTLSHYVDYTLILLFGHIVAFEICLILLLMVHFQILSVEWLCTKRRHMIVLAFILGALLTPPDVLTQVMLALPLIGIYELAILYGKWTKGPKSFE